MHNRSLKPRGGGGHPITASPADPFLGRSRSVCFLRPHLGFKVAITLWMLSSSPPAAQPRHCAFWDPILPVLGPILPGLVGSGFDGAEGFVIPLRPREGGVFFSGTVMVAAMPDYQAAVDDFVTKLRRRQVEGSLNTAKQTAEILRQVISSQRLPNVGQAAVLIDAVKTVGLRMIAASPIELAVGNIVRRVLHIIREEDVSLTSPAILGVSVESDDDESDTKSSYSAAAVAAANRSALRAPSLHNLLESIPDPVKAPEAPAASIADSESRSRSGDRNSVSWKLKHNVIEGITELLQDIDNYHSQVAEQAIEHIHQNEVILTLGRSRSLLKFLLEAKKKRSFQVVIAEGAPKYQGHILSKELAEKGLQTTVITDSAVFAMISRVNMVIVGAHAVMANGGVLAPVGMHMVALAARRHAVPFVVLAGVHKLCPQYPHNPYTLLNDMKSPAEIVDFGELSDCLDVGTDVQSTYVVNPTFDYIPPELVSLFITDTGGHNPSYVYRLIAEYYSPEDYVLQ